MWYYYLLLKNNLCMSQVVHVFKKFHYLEGNFNPLYDRDENLKVL